MIIKSTIEVQEETTKLIDEAITEWDLSITKMNESNALEQIGYREIGDARHSAFVFNYKGDIIIGMVRAGIEIKIDTQKIKLAKIRIGEVVEKLHSMGVYLTVEDMAEMFITSTNELGRCLNDTRDRTNG